MKNSAVIAIGAAGLAAAAAAIHFGLGQQAAPPPFSLQPDDTKVAAQGAKIYTAQCAACHGAALEGQPNWRSRGPDGMLPAPPHDASGHTWHHPDEVLFKLTKFGAAKVADLKVYKTAMPIYEGVLSDADIVAVLSWIKSQWPASVRERQDQINAQHRADSPR